MEQLYLSPREAAQELTRLGIKTSKSTIYKMFDDPSFPKFRLRGKLFVKRDELLAWIESGADSGAAA